MWPEAGDNHQASRREARVWLPGDATTTGTRLLPLGISTHCKLIEAYSSQKRQNCVVYSIMCGKYVHTSAYIYQLRDRLTWLDLHGTWMLHGLNRPRWGYMGAEPKHFFNILLLSSNRPSKFWSNQVQILTNSPFLEVLLICLSPICPSRSMTKPNLSSHTPTTWNLSSTTYYSYFLRPVSWICCSSSSQ